MSGRSSPSPDPALPAASIALTPRHIRQSAMASVRIDKWLWAARFFKTRALASKACDLGRIHSNSIQAKPAREVRVSDMLTIRNESGEFQVEVLALSEMRGPAAVAQTLYRETEASKQARLKAAAERKAMQELPRSLSTAPPSATAAASSSSAANDNPAPPQTSQSTPGAACLAIHPTPAIPSSLPAALLAHARSPWPPCAGSHAQIAPRSAPPEQWPESSPAAA